MKDQEYYDSLDKRTSEYKEYKKSKGLGDDVEKVLKATGIKALAKVILGKDCPKCDERKSKLNNLFPRNVKAVRCMTNEHITAYRQYVESRTLNIWNDADITLLTTLYAHVFAIRYDSKEFCRGCQGTAKTLLKITTHLDEVYNSYKIK